jgi:hypothetical protein
LAKTAFQIRGRVFDDMGCDQIGEIEHGPIIRRPSCHLLRGKLAISQGSVRNLLSAATLRATVLNRADSTQTGLRTLCSDNSVR